MNRALAGWIEGEYHQSPHRGLDGQTPLDRWTATGAEVRYPDAAGLDLEDLFLFETKRRVMKDRTLSLHGRLYEADAILIGCTVTVRYDPAAPASRALQVVHEGRPAGLVLFTKCRWQRSTKSRLQAQWRTPSNHEWLACARDVDRKLRGAQD